MSYTELGFGVGYRSEHYRWILENSPKIDWFEIISENFLAWEGRPRWFLEQLRSQYPVVMHGVSLSIGSDQPLNQEYLVQLKSLADAIEPSLISDHLCWTRFAHHNTHDLLPVPYTQESLDKISAKVSQVQEFMGRQFLLENASAYVANHSDEMTEAEFLRELVQKTGCGLLLDLNNLFVNSCNLGIDPISYLELLPLESVQQFHIAGHKQENGIRVDTHDEPVVDEVWALYRLAKNRWPKVPTLLEWDANIPSFSRLMEEVNKAKRLSNTHFTQEELLAGFAQCRTQVAKNSSSKKMKASSTSLSSYQEKFYNLVTNPEGISEDNQYLNILDTTRPVSAKLGAGVYQNAYFVRLKEALLDTYPTLAYVCEDDGFHLIAAHYFQKFPPQKESISYAGEHLERFLKSNPVLNYDFGVSLDMLADLASLEWSLFEVSQNPLAKKISIDKLLSLTEEQWNQVRFSWNRKSAKLLSLNFDAGAVIDAYRHDMLPPRPIAQKWSCLVYREGDDVKWDLISEFEAKLCSDLMDGNSFYEACSKWILDPQDMSMAEAAVSKALACVKKLVERGVITGIDCSDAMFSAEILPHVVLESPDSVQLHPGR